MSWLRLLRSRRVGISTFWRLLREHETAQAALAALPGVAQDAGVENYQICPEGVVMAEIRNANACGATPIFWGDAHYPALLGMIDDAPPMLWCIGDLTALQKPKVAIVGARNASSLGLRMARQLAEGVGRSGRVTVSGLARGIDTSAHLASVPYGTIAVMGGGVDVIYPSENMRLAEEIVSNGGLRLSEQPMGVQPLARHFPARNRIISGLASAVVVVEAAAKSGSLITARGALDQGRDVLAVPGHPLDARASGCNMLIRDGARLVRNIDDILEMLPETACEPANATQSVMDLRPPDVTDLALHRRDAATPKQSTKQKRVDLARATRLHQQILNKLGPSPASEDQLIRDLGLGSGQVAPALTDLELDGKIERHPGGLLAKASSG